MASSIEEKACRFFSRTIIFAIDERRNERTWQTNFAQLVRLKKLSGGVSFDYRKGEGRRERKGVKGGGKGGSRVTPAASFRDACVWASSLDFRRKVAACIAIRISAPSGAWTNLLDSRPSNSLRTRLPNELHMRAHARTKDHRIFDACLETGIRIKIWISDWIIE